MSDVEMPAGIAKTLVMFPYTLVVGAALLTGSGAVHAAEVAAASDSRRPWTVADSIAMRHFVGDFTMPGTVNGQSAPRVVWSPSRKYFFFLERRGDLGCDCNIYQLQVFSAQQLMDILKDPQRRQWQPQALRAIEFSSSRSEQTVQSITQPEWEGDDALLFLGVKGRAPKQLYRWELDSDQVRQLTQSPADLATHAVNGDTVIYRAFRQQQRHVLEKYPAVSVTADELFQLAGAPVSSSEMFVSYKGGTHISLGTSTSLQGGPWLAPDARHAIVAMLSDSASVPGVWSGYELPVRRGTPTGMQFMLVDLQTGHMRPLVNAPVGAITRAGWAAQPTAAWSPDSRHVVLVNTALPLDTEIGKREELQERRTMSYVVDVDVTSGEWTLVDTIVGVSGEASLKWLGIGNVRWEGSRHLLIGYEAGDARNHIRSGLARYTRTARGWLRTEGSSISAAGEQKRTAPLNVSFRESANSPPMPIASDGKHELMLAPADPALDRVYLAPVETVDWTEPGGRKVSGGLRMPLRVSHPVPLIIQAYYYWPDRFAPDGTSPTAYAAQPLVSEGMAVLQVDIPSTDQDRKWAGGVTGTIEEGKAFVARIDSAVAALAARGLVDERKVGLVGFSRAGFLTYYAITHMQETELAAAVVADGWSASYGEYVIDAAISHPGGGGNIEYDEYYGGGFWANKSSWVEHAPGFNIDKIRTPVLFTTGGTFNNILMLETLGGLRITRRPYEYLSFPTGNHQLQLPRERAASMESTVDWMSFWLQDKERLGADKLDQYERWRSIKSRWEASRSRGAAGSVSTTSQK